MRRGNQTLSSQVVEASRPLKAVAQPLTAALGKKAVATWM